MTTSLIQQTRAQILSEALPYIQKYHGKTLVIKYGGNAMETHELKTQFAQDVVMLKLMGIYPVIVHGGAPQIKSLLKRVGKETEFVQGMRITDKETIEIVEMALIGQTNTDIVSLINQYGGRAVGLSGKDANMLSASKLLLPASNPNEAPLDIGQVGLIQHIDTSVIRLLEQGQFIPVIAPLGVGENGESFNINADVVAGKLAEALKAEKLIMLTNTPGVLDEQGQCLPKISTHQIHQLIEKGVIKTGMLPKINAALSAVENGVNSVRILDGRLTHSLLLEVLTDQKDLGTIIYASATN